MFDTTQPTRALVLGGGGSAGNAWLIGVVAGLVDRGVDVTDADLYVGTSAGATAVAQLAGAAPSDLLDEVLSAVIPQRVGTAGRPSPTIADYMERSNRIISAATGIADMRRAMGAAAIQLASESEGATERWRAIVATRLPMSEWPHRRLAITAVDAATGEPAVFTNDSGVDLVDAVAASCSNSVAYSIGTRSYIDGGYRSNADNADLGAGFDRVLVLSPFGGLTRTPAEWKHDLATQIDELRAGGSTVETVLPDAASLAAFGDNVMNPASRPPAARAGFEQGKALAAALAEFWGRKTPVDEP